MVKEVNATKHISSISDRLRKDLDKSLSSYKKTKKSSSVEKVFKRLGYDF